MPKALKQLKSFTPAFSKWPDILGYCGDVLFPSIVLNQIVELADSGLLFSQNDSCEQKFEAIIKKMNDLFSAYPALQVGFDKNSLQVIHASRAPNDNKKFFCRSIRWSQKQSRWLAEEISMPQVSDVLLISGSGKKEFEENYARYRLGPNRDTSRNVFHCFCDTLNHIKDPAVGGAPQIVGVYRKPGSSAINIGVIFGQSRFTLPSMEIIDLSLPTSIAFFRNSAEGLGGVIASHADELKHGLRYHPMLLGADYLNKIGALNMYLISRG